jgi:hypothetical protein
MSIIAALVLIGLIVCVAKQQYLLPAWMFLPFLIEPRGAATVAIIPAALMGGIALHELVFPGTAAAEAAARRVQIGSYFQSRAVRILGAYLALFVLVIGLYAGMQLAEVRLQNADRAAMDWVAGNTPPQSRFLILTGDAELFCDPVQEWFPVLAGRVSETTIQGHEWTSQGSFFGRVTTLQALQACLQDGSPGACMREKAAALDASYDYIWVSRSGLIKQSCRPIGEASRGAALTMELAQDKRYSLVYSVDAIEVFTVNSGFTSATAEVINATPTSHVNDSVSRK